MALSLAEELHRLCWDTVCHTCVKSEETRWDVFTSFSGSFFTSCRWLCGARREKAGGVQWLANYTQHPERVSRVSKLGARPEFALGRAQPPLCFLTISSQDPTGWDVYCTGSQALGVPCTIISEEVQWLRPIHPFQKSLERTSGYLAHSGFLTNTYQNILHWKTIPWHHGNIQVGAASFTSIQYFLKNKTFRHKSLNLAQPDGLLCEVPSHCPKFLIWFWANWHRPLVRAA